MFQTFRFRRRKVSIIAIYRCMKHSDKRVLHPSEIARLTGMHMLTVIRVLSAVPELFFKVPQARSAGVTGYALTTATFAKEEEDVVKFINRKASLENWVYWGILATIFVAFIYAILTMIPVLGDGTSQIF